MFPIFLKLGPVSLHTYGLMVALGALLGLNLTIFLAVRDGMDKKTAEDDFYRLLFFLLISGIVGARAVYVATFSQEFIGNWTAVFKIWEGGLVSYGGLAGGLAGFFLWARKSAAPWKKALDWMAPGFVLGHAIGRIGCFSAGCCYGSPTDEPWGIVFMNPESLAPLGIALHPTQIYEFLFLIPLGGYLFRRNVSQRGNAGVPGSVFAEYLLIYSAGRFVIEFFRGDIPRFWGLSTGQLMSAAVFFAGFISFVLLQIHARKNGLKRAG